jgi:hypothetical protein
MGSAAEDLGDLGEDSVAVLSGQLALVCLVDLDHIFSMSALAPARSRHRRCSRAECSTFFQRVFHGWLEPAILECGRRKHAPSVIYLLPWRSHRIDGS